MPKVSIVMPAYNAARYIQKTIYSLFDQTYPDFELLVIDDGSTDETLQVVSEIADKRIRCISQPNLDAPAARNVGLNQCTGEFVAFLDADDWWDERFLELMVPALERLPTQYAVAHCDWAYADGDGQSGEVHSSAFDKDATVQTLLHRCPFAIHAALSRRAALMEVNGFDAQLPASEDWDLWLRLAAFGYHFIHVPMTLAYYHWHPGSRSTNLENRRNARLLVLDRFWSHEEHTRAYSTFKGSSYATTYVDFCVARFASGDVEGALKEFGVACEYDPTVLGNLDTYYRIAYADQAGAGITASLRTRLNDDAAHTRINLILNHLSRSSKYGDPVQIVRTARGAAHFALGLAYYREQRMQLSRHHLLRASRADRTLWSQTRLLQTFAKTFLPASMINYVHTHRLALLR